jgi:hypothetical protein
MVLLQNEPVDGESVLPLSAGISSLAVIGRLADMPNTGDHGSSDVRSPHVVTALAGLGAALPNTRIVHVPEDDPRAAAAAAAESEVAVVIVGYTADDEGEYVGSALFADPALMATFPPPANPVDEQFAASLAAASGSDAGIGGGIGEGGDRASLRLRQVDVEIIRAAVAANPRTVVVIVAAGAVITEEWRHEVPALVMGWYSGSEGGHALADVLLGRVDASGRLPFSIPVDEVHLPFFDRDATRIDYDGWYGQRKFDHDGNDAAFPLGFGLSYTYFVVREADAERTDAESLRVRVAVENRGDRAGRHVVQVYGRRPESPVRALLGFAPVELDAHGSADVDVTASLRPLQDWTDEGFVLRAGELVIEASSYSGDPEAATTSLTV